MALFTTVVSSLIFIFLLITNGYSDRTKDKMYRDLDGAFCFRRMTANHQHGCSSSLNGDTGVIHFIDSEKDLFWLLSGVPTAAPYVPVVQLKDFDRSMMLHLRDSGQISGIIIYKNATVEAFSPEDTCPNRKTGLASESCDAKDAWNPSGNSLLFVDWGFPVVYIEDLTAIQHLRDCFLKYNADLNDQKERNLCAVQLRSHMQAAVDTQTCMRRNTLGFRFAEVSFCDPLGGQSIYQTIQPISGVQKSVILLIARQDGASLFDGMVPGAMSPITNVVTLFTVMNYLRDMNLHAKNSDKNLMVLLLNGEAFDYIGSSRILYDMGLGKFPNSSSPLTLGQISLIIELDQLYGDQYFYHTKSSGSEMLTLVANLEKELGKDGIKFNKTEGKLPPASIQRFLMNDSSIDHVLITNYNSSYLTPYYHSIEDNPPSLKYKYAAGSEDFGDIQHKIDKVSMGLAKSLYSLLYNEDYAASIKSKIHLVDELLHCYLESQNCSLFYNVTNGAALWDKPAPVYVGVYRERDSESMTNYTRFNSLVLTYLSGEVAVNVSSAAGCKNESAPGRKFFWMTDTCINSSIGLYAAYSPAFEIEGYNWSSNAYSTWTESVWSDMSIRMFLRPPYKHEVFSVTIGLLVLLVSFVIVYIVRAKSDVMFNRVV